MPDPKDNAKQRGDIHPPEIESDLPDEGQAGDSPDTGASPANRGKAAGRGEIPRPGRVSKKAGLPSARGDETRDSDRESGE